MIEVSKENLEIVKDTVEAYRYRKLDCLNGTYDLAIEEKNWGSATEDLQRSHILQRKRLSKRGVSMEIEETDISRIPFLGGIPFVRKERFFQDGEYTVGCVRKKVKRSMLFTKKEERIGEFYKNIRLHYYTTGEPGEEADVSSEDVFYSKEPFDERGEYWNDARWIGDIALLALVYGVLVLLVGITVVGLGHSVSSIFKSDIIFSSVSRTAEGLKILAMLPMLIPLVIAIPLKQFVKWYRFLYQKRKKSKEVLEKIRGVKPDFSIEKFISVADSRMKAAYYMEDMQDVEGFVSCDIQDWNISTSCVLHCDMTSFWFDSFYQDEKNQYMEVTHRAAIFEDGGRRIKEMQRMVKVLFVRPKESIMTTDYYYDWYIDKIEMNKDFKGIKWEIVKNKSWK